MELREALFDAITDCADGSSVALTLERVLEAVYADPEIAEALALKKEVDELKLGHTTG